MMVLDARIIVLRHRVKLLRIFTHHRGCLFSADHNRGMSDHTRIRRTRKRFHGGAIQMDEGGARTKANPFAKPPSKPPLRFHILCVPHTVTRKDYSACAFTQKALKFCKMMHERGHIIYHYGHKDSEVKCTEHITITDNDLFHKAYGVYDWKKEIPKHNTSDLCNKTYNERAIVEVGKRKKPMDYLLLFWGIGHADVAKAHPDMISVEPGIGSFNTPCTPFSIFESYCVMNFVYGRERWEPRWTDAVIPNYFDLADFKVNTKPGDYFMYLGRIIESKGIGIAVEIAKRTGLKLKVAGQGDFKRELGFDPPPNVELVGYLEPEARSEMLRGALALLAPTHYNEPFGGVTVESLLCGTPIITSDWGAFAENNLHGVTGYRCRSLEQFIWAAKNIDKIDRTMCRKFAEMNFSLERVAPMYEEYFNSLKPYFGAKGFYQLNPERKDLDWMQRYYPCSE
jgi:glycosyltransferase involved in cell wall biosynthesis